MQLAPAPNHSSLDFKKLIKRAVDEITQRWIEAVRADRSIPSAKDLEEPLLKDAVPLVLEEIFRVIDSDDGGVRPQRVCGAARHGRERAQEHFDIRELVREYQILREQVFDFVRENTEEFAKHGAADSSIYLRIGLALDAAARETTHAFVEEHIKQLRRLSRTDGLTGLYNHRLFYERLSDEFNRAKRYDSPLAIVLVDLDNFKSVNDTKGHQFGDYLLVKCAQRLREDLRQTDIICRYGGDEFALILTETTGEEAEVMMRRLANAFTQLGRREGAPGGFGVSFGVSSHPADQGTLKRMVKVADDRLLLSKKEGRFGRAGESGIQIGQ